MPAVIDTIEMPLSEIVFDEAERQRTVYNELESLADSIKEKGLLQPLGVEDGTNRLVWGGRRYLASKKAGLKEVPVRLVMSGLYPLDLKELELLENVEREGLTWQEELDAILEIDKLKKSRHGDCVEEGSKSCWSTRKTADLLGKAPSGVAADLQLAEAIRVMPELAEAPNKSEAHRRLKKTIENLAVKEILKDLSQKDRTFATFRYASGHYMIGDALEELRKQEPGQATFAEVDPPYAINIHKNKRADILDQNLKTYHEWDLQTYKENLKIISHELYRILADQAWAIFWCGSEGELLDATYKILVKAKFTVDKIPAVWIKEGSPGQTKQPEAYLGRAYEKFFVCRKGLPSLRKAGRSNVFSFKVVSHQKKIHTTEKPLALYQELLDTFVYPGSYIISPFLGSGNILRAAYTRSLSGFGWNLEDSYKEAFLSRVYEDESQGLYGGTDE